MSLTPRTLIISTLCSAFTLVPQWVSANFTVNDGETVGGQVLVGDNSVGTINEGGTINENSSFGVEIIYGDDITLINNGVITTSGLYEDGVYGSPEGIEIINTGSIITNSFAISVYGNGATITNSGEIRSNNGTAIQVAGGDASLTLQEGSQIIGDIRFSGSNNTLTTTGNLQLDDDINDADIFNTNAGAGETQIFNGNIIGTTSFNINDAGSVILNGNNPTPVTRPLTTGRCK